VDFLRSKKLIVRLKYEPSKSRPGEVLRFIITKNPNADIAGAPSMHVTYSTAQVIFKDILHLPNAFNGHSIDVGVDELEKAFRLSSGEVTEERYWPYIEQLERLVAYAKKNGFNKITGA
jgi:hypothetical protein